MAKNVSREFATMDDDQRRRFALEQPNDTLDGVRPVEFPGDDPRKPPPHEPKPGGGRR